MLSYRPALLLPISNNKSSESDADSVPTNTRITSSARTLLKAIFAALEYLNPFNIYSNTTTSYIVLQLQYTLFTSILIYSTQLFAQVCDIPLN